jgi:hypothetical protein
MPEGPLVTVGKKGINELISDCLSCSWSCGYDGLPSLSVQACAYRVRDCYKLHMGNKLSSGIANTNLAIMGPTYLQLRMR